MRRRWTEEKRLQRQQADWIVGYIRRNGPLTTREVIEALRKHGRSVESHVIARALRKSQFIHLKKRIDVDGEFHSVWEFRVDDQ
jgi:hypothetical protein